MNEALRDWVSNVDDTFYVIGTVVVPTISYDGKRLSVNNWYRGKATNSSEERDFQII